MRIPRLPGSTAGRVRAGWLSTTLALAAALVISSWSNYRAAMDAVATLNTGQAEIHSSALRSVEPRGGLEGNVALLASVLESQSEAGLRSIALIESDGTVSTSVGEAIAEVTLPTSLRSGQRFTGPVLFDTGDRIRAYVSRPPDRLGFGGGGQRAGDLPGVGRDSVIGFRFQGGPRAGQFYLLEFDPVPASNVVSQAVRGLILSGLGAALLTLVALGFWRVSRGYEAAQAQIEHQKRLSQLGEMSAVLAHEIRNPLASLKGNAQLLAEGLIGAPSQQRRADRVVGEAIRLEALTSDLLDFARTAPISRTPTDPAELLRSAAYDVAPNSVEIDASTAPEVWRLDRGKLRQALVNLIRNACQVSPEGRPPIATVSGGASSLVFTVRDFGPGIDTSELGRIFEPFFTTRTQGTGLGLPVAKRAVELHGGTLTAANHPDGGAVFEITLPSAGD